MDPESSLPLILDKAPDIVYSLSGVGEILSLNQAAEGVLGYARSELLGTSIFQFIHPEDRERLKASMEEAVRNQDEEVRTIEFRMVTRNGDVKYFEVNRRLVFEGGRVLRNEGIARDVTERRRSEEEREALQRLSQRLAEALSVEEIGRVVAEESRRLFGHDAFSLDLCDEEAQELRGVRCEDTPAGASEPQEIPVIDCPVTPLLRQVLDGQQGLLNQCENTPPSSVYRFGEESRRTQSLMFVPVRWKSRTVGILSVQCYAIDRYGDRDLQLLQAFADQCGGALGRARAEEALRESEARLFQAEKMAALGNLMAGIAHEINTPIGAIHSMHDTLVRAVEKLKEVIENDFSEELKAHHGLQRALKIINDCNRVIETGTERVTTIVRSLRNFARVDEAEYRDVDVHQGLEDTLMLVHHDIKGRVEVVRNYGDLPLVCCRAGRLNQVFLNILNNAQQAIDGKGVITISTSKRDDEVEVAIQDSGAGIPAENLERIFEPGFTTKPMGTGTGLGLSICCQILREHGGRIEVDSTPDTGTTFTVILPLGGCPAHGD